MVFFNKLFGFLSVAQNSYEQDTDAISTTTASTTFGNYPVAIQRTPHLRIRSESLSNGSSAPSSPNATSPMSVSPSTLASLLPSLFSGTTNTRTNTNQSNVIEDVLAPLHTRRNSQSEASDKQNVRYPLARRYTLPNINVGNITSNEKNQGGGLRAPLAKFWEIGGREDSSVQVAMEHVQFGA